LNAWAAQFSLQVRELTVPEAMALPGGHGAYGGLSAVRPVEVKKLPDCKSKHPLFSVLARQDGRGRGSEHGMLFLFDESQGTGKGYDRLIVDLNGNGDLTDDPVQQASAGSGEVHEHFERQLFGPVLMPESTMVGAWHPRFCVEVYVFNRSLLRDGTGDMLHHIGQMRTRTGSLLVADVEVNGVKERLGVVDGNVNFRIGDAAAVAQYTRTPGRTTWYLMPSDYLLRGADRPGREVAEPLSTVAYFGGKPFSVTLAEDLKWIRLEPFAGATGELELGEDVARLILGRQMAEGTWEAVSPALEKGKAILPAGTYRISNLMIESKDTRKIQLTTYDVPLKPVELTGDQTVRVGVGRPIRLDVTAEKRSARPGEVAGTGVINALRGMLGSRGNGAGETIVQLGVSVFGQADEQYGGFSAGAGGQLPPPRFEVFSDGKRVGSGDFEYG
jgi:hypothetical protein